MNRPVFEWDPNKNEINKKKHGLSFETATQVFADEFAKVYSDPEHSDNEDRFVIIGMILSRKVCVVNHCFREGDRIRLISARYATKTEKNYYFSKR